MARISIAHGETEQQRKERERDKYLGKGNGLVLNQEVVYRNPTQVFMRVRIGKKRIEESRRAVGGQERLLTESSPNWSL